MKHAFFTLICSFLLVGCESGPIPASEPTDTSAEVEGDASPNDAPFDDATSDAPEDAPPFVPPPELDLVQHVDPFIGTDGQGNVVPGALVPHGVVRASPVTNSGQGSIDAYEHGDGEFFGIAHMHLEGPGGSANGYGHILLQPGAGSDGSPHVPDPETEVAEPGYYSVQFEGADTGLEVTATQWAAVHRYSFADDAVRTVELNLEESRGRSIGGSITATAANMLNGSAKYQVHPAVSAVLGDGQTGEIEVYWTVVFDPEPAEFVAWQSDEEPAPLDSLSGRNLHALAVFAPDVETVEARVALSMVDVAQSAENLAEVEGGFEMTRERAAEAWNHHLNRVRIEPDGQLDPENAAADLVRFYTGLYHSAFQPADYSEGERFVSAWSGEPEVFELPANRRYFSDDWCMWDTYRTSQPLRTLLEPALVDDLVWSLLHAHQTGGWIPKCSWAANGYSRVMTGNPQVAIIADAVTKGFDGFDRALALEAVRHTSESDSNPFPAGLCGYFGLGTPIDYLTLGYVPRDCDPTQSASTTLEIAYADWTVARMAEAMGETEIAELYDERSARWRRHWDEDSGYIRALNRDGSWVEPFDPDDTSDANDFVEASSWIFSFFAPHDFDGLVEVHGGTEAFVDGLNEFFEGGRYDPTNQPSFHIPWLYGQAGEHSRGAERVHESLEQDYGTGRDGLPGNDDAGSTSAWFVLASIGLYPVAPGSADYDIGIPLYDRVELILEDAGRPAASFVIEVEREGSGRSVVNASLNGSPLSVPRISHEQIAAGGTLRLVLGDTDGVWDN